MTNSTDKEADARMAARDDELAEICTNGVLKAELGMKESEQLMLVVYCVDDGDPEDVAKTIADRLGQPVVVVDLEDDEEALAFARPQLPRAGSTQH